MIYSIAYSFLDFKFYKSKKSGFLRRVERSNPKNSFNYSIKLD